MYHELFRDASFWLFLLSVDKDLAATAHRNACPCGGRLHRANYPRNPRGGPDDLPGQYRYRFSFCCDREGCRKRVTPPSVRFLGPKVYLSAVVILVAAMRQGPSPRRVRELSNRFGADRRTIVRWQIFWKEHFPRTPFWKVARGHLVPVVEIVALPLVHTAWVTALVFSVANALLLRVRIRVEEEGLRRIGRPDDDS